MFIGGKESSCKVKAEKWKVSQKRWIKGIGVGIWSEWYRRVAVVPK